MDELLRQLYLRQTRRSFLGAAAKGIGSIALAAMVNPSLTWGAETAASQPGVLPASKGVINPLHFAPRPSGSSTFTWPVGRRTSRRSTTSPSSPK
jgi:hypothetical protein